MSDCIFLVMVPVIDDLYCTDLMNQSGGILLFSLFISWNVPWEKNFSSIIWLPCGIIYKEKPGCMFDYFSFYLPIFTIRLIVTDFFFFLPLCFILNSWI